MRVQNPGNGFDALFGIDGHSSNDVWTVGARDLHGDYQPLIEHWDGSAWRVVGAARGADGAVLLGVMMRTADDGWAVGAIPGPGASILRWNGDRWARMPDAPPARGDRELLSVTATGPEDAWAVGTRDVPSPGVISRFASVTEHFDGTSWRRVSNPTSGTRHTALLAVSATGPNDVWAAGVARMDPTQENVYAARSALMEHWKGDGWVRVAVPQPGARVNALFDVETVDGSDAWAVGGFGTSRSRHPLVIHWDGNAWRQVRVPQPARSQALLSTLTIAPDGDIWAFGNWQGPKKVWHALIEHFDGRTWRIERAPASHGLELISGSTALGSEDWYVGASESAGRSFAARRCEG